MRLDLRLNKTMNKGDLIKQVSLIFYSPFTAKISIPLYKYIKKKRKRLLCLYPGKIYKL